MTGTQASPGHTARVTPAHRTSLREEQKRLTRERLLDAAVQVFGEKSFVNATMEDIASAAGVARVTLYAHFPGKAEVINGLADRVYQAMGEVFTGLAELPRWDRSAVRAWLDEAGRRWREIAALVQVAHLAGAAAAQAQNAGDAGQAPGRYRSANEHYAELLLGDGRRWRSVPAEEAHQRVLMVVLQTESFLTTWIPAGVTFRTADPLDLLADSLCHLLEPALD